MLTLQDLSSVDRIVSLDAETTGYPTRTQAEVLKLPKGLRLPGVMIQLGCVEMLRVDDVWTTGRTWETLINPDGPVQPASIAVHGIHPMSLRKAPRFSEIVDQFDEFLAGSPLLAHGARNEISFLNYEMRRAKLASWDAEPFHEGRFIDTQDIARTVFPGAPGNLDALCDRLWIDRSGRFEHHGALLDAGLTADAFMKMVGGFVTEEVRTFSI